MKRSCLVLFLLLILQINQPSGAFEIDIHRDITGYVLRSRFLLSDGSSPRFSQLAIIEIQNANECVDKGAQLFSNGDELDSPCLPSGYTGLAIHQNPPGNPLPSSYAGQDHFDNEQIVEGMVRVRWLKEQVILFANQGRYTQARKVLGMALHTVQDFYSHSNWVELNKTDIFAQMDKTGDDGNIRVPPAGVSGAELPILSPPDWRLAGQTEDVCESRLEFRPTTARGHPSGPNSPVRIQPPDPMHPTAFTVTDTGALASNSVGVTGYVLTSGYWIAQPGAVSKCNHGDVLGSSGINKDTPHSQHGKFFPEAHRVATEHTMQFVLDCLKSLQGDPKAVTGLTSVSQVKVLGNKKNLAFEVKLGEWYKFEPDPQQTVTWGWNNAMGIDLGVTGILMGKSSNPMTCGPGGTPGITTNTYRWYEPPPIPEVNVGALIGSIYNPECAYPNTNAAGDPCPPLKLVKIGAGGSVRMTASGILFLHVNDANLGNNQGYFDVSYTLEKRAGP
jgi:hypothetical protein